MLRNKPKLEGPLAAMGGSLIGGLIGGGGTIAGLASAGGIIGSLVGSAVLGSVLGGKSGSEPSQQSISAPAVPGAPTAPGLPQAQALPQEGASTPPTAEELARGKAESTVRRGRLSTILSQTNTAGGDTSNERLGG